MARMIPNRFIGTGSSGDRGERHIYNLLKDSPSDWYVFHSYNITRNPDRDEKEIDFIVVAPLLGVFILEVKQGLISCIDGIWYQNGSKIKKSPFEQASKGMHTVIDEIENNKMLSHFTHGYGVVFLDMDEFKVGSLQEEQWQVYDKRNKDNISEFIKDLSLHNKHSVKQTTLNKEDIPSIIKLLRPNYDILLTTIIKGTNNIIKKLTNDQYLKLDELEDNRQLLIWGPAGTGKTLLSLEVAQRSIQAGNKVGLFCYNTILGNWYNTQINKNKSILISGNLHDFMFKHIQDTNTELLTPDKKPFFTEWENAKLLGYLYPKNLLGVHDFWEKDISEAMLKSLKKMPVKFDKIIIDECQDLLIHGYLKVFDELLIDGLKDGKWSMFGDYDQQSVHNKSKIELESEIDYYTNGKYPKSKLIINCRNTKPISDEIIKITGLGSCKIRDEMINIETSPVSYYVWNDDKDQKEILENIVGELNREGIVNKDIIILSAIRHISESIISKVSFPTNDYDHPYIGNIRFSSIRRYKGLESSVIIITDLKTYNDKNLLYQGMSRACNILKILESKEARKERLKE